MGDIADTRMPGSRKKTLIQFFHHGNGATFICGVNGNVTTDSINDIEVEFLDNIESKFLDDIFKKGAGNYLFQVNWEQAQTDEHERVEIPGYWNFHLILFQPLMETDYG